MESPIVWRTMEHGLVQHQDHCPKMINEKPIIIDLFYSCKKKYILERKAQYKNFYLHCETMGSKLRRMGREIGECNKGLVL